MPRDFPKYTLHDPQPAAIEENEKMLKHDGWKMQDKVYDRATKNHSLGTQAVDLWMEKLFQERDWRRHLVGPKSLAGADSVELVWQQR